MNIDGLLDNLDELLDNAWSLPLTNGRTMVDAKKVREIIDDIRLNMPQEIKQAKAIVSDRTDIINEARAEAEAIIRKAENRAKAMISQEEIYKQAQAKANEIISQAQIKSREMRTAASEYVESLIKKAEDTFTQGLTELRNTKLALKNLPKNPKV